MYQDRYLRCVPFVRLVIPLGLGIWCADFMAVEASWPFLLLCSFCFVSVLVIIRVPQFYRNFRCRWFLGIAAFLFLFFGGMVLVVHSLPSMIKEPVKVNADAVVKKQEITTGGYYRLSVSPVKIRAESFLRFKPTDLWQIITRPTDTMSPASVFPGDTISFHTVIKGPQEPVNPEAFNYGRYLFRNGVAGSSFVPEADMEIKGRGYIGGLQGKMEAIRRRVQHSYSSFGIEDDELNVLAALTLGMREDLGYEVKERFVRSGAVHILAVSGLHVGIVFLILNFFFSLFMPRQNWIKLFLILSGLWFFALLTGGAPSVLRAVIMFSIIQVGGAVNRPTNILNLLGASGFLILVVDPLSLFNAGFWLSHLAVAGIVSLYPLFSRVAVGWPGVLRWLWNLISVSLSAQIATFPLSVFLFKAFPVYFLLANVLILPLVAPIIVLAAFLILFSKWGFVARMVAGSLNDLLSFMNEVVQWLDVLPGAYQERLWISWPMMICLYMFLVLFLLFMEFRNRHLIMWSIGALAGVFFFLNVQYLTRTRTDAFVVFDAGRELIIGSVQAGHGCLWCSQGVTDKKCSFISDGFFTKNARSLTKGSWFCKSSLLADSSLVVWPAKGGYFLGVGTFDVDKIQLKKQIPIYGVVLFNEIEGDIVKLMNRLECNHLILSSGCPRWWIVKWKETILEQEIGVYDVSKEGGFLQQF